MAQKVETCRSLTINVFVIYGLVSFVVCLIRWSWGGRWKCASK